MNSSDYDYDDEELVEEDEDDWDEYELPARLNRPI